MGTAELLCCDITAGVRSGTETGQPEHKLSGEKSSHRSVQVAGVLSFLKVPV